MFEESAEDSLGLVLCLQDLEHMMRSLVGKIRGRREPAAIDDDVGTVMYADSSLARKSAAKAISSALPLLRSNMVFSSILDCIFFMTGFDIIDAVRSVSIQPGWMTLERMPQSA